LNSQIEKVGGCVIFPSCPLPIPENTRILTLGKANTGDPITGTTYHPSQMGFATMMSENRYFFYSLTNLKPLLYVECETLRLVNADEVKDFSPIGEMTSLKHLHIVYSSINESSVLCKIDWITKLTNLESVTFYHCKGITDISPLCGLKNLKTLDIRGSGLNNTTMLAILHTLSICHIQITK
jgi:hypothetical protein